MAQAQDDALLSGGSLAGSNEALVLPQTPARSSNKHAMKVAGLVTLACLLLASQAFTAYMVFGQKQQIHTLQRNADKLGKRLTRAAQAPSPMRMQLPVSSLPLLRNFSPDEDTEPAKQPMTKLQAAMVSVEKQVKDLIQGVQLPQFNETFMSNVQSLKHQMNESEWQSFETWMRYWLIFQMAQQQPPPPTSQPATLVMTKCQIEAVPGPSKIGSYKPQCDEQGRYKPLQCWHATGYCWCVTETGTTIDGTVMRGRPDCQRAIAPRRMMAAPMLMQKALSLDDDQ